MNIISQLGIAMLINPSDKQWHKTIEPHIKNSMKQCGINYIVIVGEYPNTTDYYTNETFTIYNGNLSTDQLKQSCILLFYIVDRNQGITEEWGQRISCFVNSFIMHTHMSIDNFFTYASIILYTYSGQSKRSVISSIGITPSLSHSLSSSSSSKKKIKKHKPLHDTDTDKYDVLYKESILLKDQLKECSKSKKLLDAEHNKILLQLDELKTCASSKKLLDKEYADAISQLNECQTKYTSCSQSQSHLSDDPAHIAATIRKLQDIQQQYIAKERANAVEESNRLRKFREQQAKEEREQEREKEREIEREREREKPNTKKPCPSYGINPDPTKCKTVAQLRKQQLLFHSSKNTGCADDATAREKYQMLDTFPECKHRAEHGDAPYRPIQQPYQPIQQPYRPIQQQPAYHLQKPALPRYYWGGKSKSKFNKKKTNTIKFKKRKSFCKKSMKHRK